MLFISESLPGQPSGAGSPYQRLSDERETVGHDELRKFLSCSNFLLG